MKGSKMNLLNNLKPVYSEDIQEWKEVIDEAGNTIPHLFWYAGAGFDRKPIEELFSGLFPVAIKNELSKNLFPIFTDYNSEIVDTLKKAYKYLDEDEFATKDLNINSGLGSKLSDIEILQMIPLSFFTTTEIENIRKNYPDCFHPGVTNSVIPDDKWHFVFLTLAVDGEEMSMIYGLIENLTFWKEVVEKFDLNVEVFCALRVGGKSGSWDHTHSPINGKLFNAIATSKSEKPKVWIADDCLKLRKIWDEIEQHENGFYGQMHFFKTIW